jgi:chromosome segregation ATPase
LFCILLNELDRTVCDVPPTSATKRYCSEQAIMGAEALGALSIVEREDICGKNATMTMIFCATIFNVCHGMSENPEENEGFDTLKASYEDILTDISGLVGSEEVDQYFDKYSQLDFQGLALEYSQLLPAISNALTETCRRYQVLRKELDIKESALQEYSVHVPYLNDALISSTAHIQDLQRTIASIEATTTSAIFDRDTTISSLNSEVAALTAEVKKLKNIDEFNKSQLEDSEKEIARLRHTIYHLESSSEDATVTIKQLEHDLEISKAQIEELTVGTQELSSTEVVIASLKQENQSKDSLVKTMTEETTLLSSQYQDSLRRMAALEQEHTDKVEELRVALAELENSETAVAEFREHTQELLELNSSMKQDIEELLAEKSQLQLQMIDVEKESLLLQQKVDELTKDVATLVSVCQAKESSVTSSRQQLENLVAVGHSKDLALQLALKAQAESNYCLTKCLQRLTESEAEIAASSDQQAEQRDEISAREDEISTLQDRIRSLERAAANDQKKLAGDLVAREELVKELQATVESLKNKQGALMEERNQLEKVVAQEAEECSRLEKVVAQEAEECDRSLEHSKAVEAENTVWIGAVREKDAAIESLQGRIESLGSAAAASAAEIANLLSQVAAMESSLSNERTENSALATEKEQLVSQIDRLAQNFEDKDKECNELHAQLAALETKVSGLQSQIADSRTEHDLLEQQLSAAESMRKDQEEMIKSLERTKLELNDAIADLRTQVAALEDAADSRTREFTEKSNNLSSVSEDNTKLKSELAARAQQNADLESEVQSLKTTIESLENEHVNLESQLAALESLLASKEAAYKELLEQLNDLRKSNEDKDSALKGIHQNMASLEASEKERVAEITRFEVSSESKDATIAEMLKTQDVSNEAISLAASRITELERRIQELRTSDDQLINESAIELSVKTNEIDELKKSIQHYQTQAEVFRTDIVALRSQCAAQEKTAEESCAELERLKETISCLRSELAESQEQVAILVNAGIHARTNIEVLERALADRTSECTGLQDKIVSLQTQIESLTSDVEAAGVLSKEQRAKIAVLQGAVDKLKAEAKEAAISAHSRSDELGRLLEANTELNAALKASADRLNEQHQELETLRVSSESSRQDLQLAIDSKNAEMKSMRSRTKELESTIGIRDKEISELKEQAGDQLNILRNQVHTDELSALDHQKELSNALRTIETLRMEAAVQTQQRAQLEDSLTKKDAECSTYEERLSAQNIIIEAKDKSAAELRATLEKLLEEQKVIEQRVVVLSAEIASKESTVADLQAANEGARSEIALSLTRVTELEDSLTKLRLASDQRIDRLTAEMEALRAELTSKDNEIDELRARVNELESKLADISSSNNSSHIRVELQMQDVSAQLSQSQQSNESLTTLVDQLKQRIADKEAESMSAQSEYETLKTAAIQSEFMLAEYRRIIDSLRAKLSDNDNQEHAIVLQSMQSIDAYALEVLAASRLREELLAELSGADATISAQAASIQQIQDKLASAESLNGDLNSRLAVLEARNAAYITQISGLEAELDGAASSLDKYKGLEAELNLAMINCLTKIDALNHKLCDADLKSQNAIIILEAENRSLLETIAAISDAVVSSMGKLEKLNDNCNMLQAENARLTGDNRESQEMIGQLSSVTQSSMGYVEMLANQVTDLEKELRTQMADNQVLQAEIDSKTEIIAKVTEGAQATVIATGRLNDQIQNLISEKLVVTEELSALRIQLSTLRAANGTLQQQMITSTEEHQRMLQQQLRTSAEEHQRMLEQQRLSDHDDLLVFFEWGSDNVLRIRNPELRQFRTIVSMARQLAGYFGSLLQNGVLGSISTIASKVTVSPTSIQLLVGFFGRIEAVNDLFNSYYIPDKREVRIMATDSHNDKTNDGDEFDKLFEALSQEMNIKSKKRTQKAASTTEFELMQAKDSEVNTSLMRHAQDKVKPKKGFAVEDDIVVTLIPGSPLPSVRRIQGMKHKPEKVHYDAINDATLLDEEGDVIVPLLTAAPTTALRASIMTPVNLPTPKGPGSTFETPIKNGKQQSSLPSGAKKPDVGNGFITPQSKIYESPSKVVRPSTHQRAMLGHGTTIVINAAASSSSPGEVRQRKPPLPSSEAAPQNAATDVKSDSSIEISNAASAVARKRNGNSRSRDGPKSMESLDSRLVLAVLMLVLLALGAAGYVYFSQSR